MLGEPRRGTAYISTPAGLANAVAVASDDDIGFQRVAGAVGNVGLWALVLARGRVKDLSAGESRSGDEESSCGLHGDDWEEGVLVYGYE